MRQALQIAMLHFRLTYKQKASLFLAFGLPILMTLVFGQLMGGQAGDGSVKGRVYPVAVVDQDNTFASRQLADALAEEANLKVQVVSEAEMKRLMADKRIDSGILIPAGFEAGLAATTTPEVHLVVPPGGNMQIGVGPILRRTANQVAESLRLARITVGDAANEAALEVAYSKIQSDRSNLAVQVTHEQAVRETQAGQSAKSILSSTSIAFTITFVMMMVFMSGGVILQERQMGTWGRLLTTPSSRVSLLLGYLFNFLFTGMFQFLVLIIATRLIFGVNWGPWPQLLVMATAVVLCSGGMGLFLAGIVRNFEQQAAMGTLFVTATSMLGGLYWPVDMMSETMQRIGRLTPQSWAMDGFMEVTARGGDWANLFWPLVVLLSLTVIFTGAGLFRVRYE